MINAGTIAASLTLDTNRFNAGIESANAQLQSWKDENLTAAEKIQGVGGALTTIGGTLTRNVTLPIVGAGVAAVKVAADFDSGMSKVQAISGATGEDLDKLRDKAREMGSKTKFSASEAADAMSYMAMAGWKTGDMLDGIEGIMNLAAASGEDLATTSDIVTDALTAFGLKAKDSAHFSDVLAAASSNANTNVSLMGETFKYVTPIAGALNFSAEDTAESIGLIANAGIKGSQGGTYLRAVMNGLTGDVKFTGKALGEVTIETVKADGSMRGLSEILDDCRGAFALMTESEKAANAETLAGREGMTGFLALMNAAPEDIGKLRGAIEDCDGTAARMADTMQNNLQGQLTVLKSQTEELAIGFGTELMPVAQDLVGLASNAVQGFSGLNDGTKKFIVYAGLAAAAAGPMASVLGSVTQGMGSLITTVSGVATAFSAVRAGTMGLGAALTSVITPAGLVVAGLAAVAAVGVALYKDLHRTNKELETFNTVMGEAADTSKEIDEITVNLEELETTRKETYAGEQEEIQSVEELTGKLEELVDENGNLIGDKEELNSVVEKLNEHGLTVELNKTGDLVKNYKDLTKSVEKYVEQKKAQAMLDALEPEYQNALANKAQYYKVYTDALREAYEVQKLLNDEDYVQGLSVKEYKELVDSYNTLNGKATKAFEKYKSACDIINAYDKSMAAIAEEDYNTATQILNGYYDGVAGIIQEKGNKGSEEQEKVINDLSAKFTEQIQAYGIVMQSGDEALIADAKSYLEQAATELEAAGVKLPEGLIAGIESGETSVEEALYRVEKASANAIEGVIEPWQNSDNQSRLRKKVAELIKIIPDTSEKQLDEHSPSKVMMKIGGFATQGLIDGMNEKKPAAVSCVTDIMKSMVTAAGSISFTGIGGNVVSGILQGLNEKKGTLLTAAQHLATGIAGVISGALRINSPSKVMIPMGQAVAEGMEVGLIQGAGSLYKTASAISLETADTLGSISSPALRLPDNRSGSSYGDRIDRLLDAVERLADSQTTMEIDGRPFGRLIREYI